MGFKNPDDNELRKILADARTIAVVGASANEDRPSYGVMRRLLSLGYDVVPVNPGQEQILGRKAYPNLSSVPQKIDIVDVFRTSEATPPIAAEAAQVGAQTLWLQLGIYNDDAVKIAREAGMQVVTDNCIAVTHSVLRVPSRG